jgi:4-aminobutyrate aminotransferase-like enzyme
MTDQFPGPKTRQALERGVPLFRNGLRFDEELEKAGRRGFRTANQIVIDHVEGDFIWDLDGRRYIDFQNGWATNPIGNAHPEILEVVDAAHRRYGFHYDHPLRYDLAEMLAQIMPNKALPRFNYEVSGTEAAEAAVHLAGVIKAPYPYSDQSPAGMSQEQYVDYCLWYLDNHIPGCIAPRNNIAGILVEPGLAEGGNWIPPTNLLKGIREICDKNDWLMISDEVLTGLGRTGKMWGIEHYDVIPDILVVGKNLSGGIVPCAGIASKDEILGDTDGFLSGSTFAGTPAGCAAGIKTLEIYERDKVVEHAAKLGELAAEAMRQWEQYDIVRQVRGNGLLLGVSFESPDPAEKNWWYARSVRNRMLNHGVWAISDREDTIRMYPALNMDEKTLLEGLDIMHEAIRYVNEHGQVEGDSPAWPTGVAGF